MTLKDASVVPAHPGTNWNVVTPCIVAGLLLAMYGCHSLVVSSQAKSTDLVQHLHQQMNDGSFDDIYGNADEVYKRHLTLKASTAMFSDITSKLGVSADTTAQATKVWTTISGIYVATTFETWYAKDSAVTEQVVWRETGGTYRLFSYKVNSRNFSLDRAEVPGN